MNDSTKPEGTSVPGDENNPQDADAGRENASKKNQNWSHQHGQKPLSRRWLGQHCAFLYKVQTQIKRPQTVKVCGLAKMSLGKNER